MRSVSWKKEKIASKGLVVKPLLSKDFNSRGQVDLVDMQSMPDGDFKFIMHYQDHLTKFSVLWALTSKRALEVGFQLLDIFLLIGAPHILQSDNGREFTANVIKEVKDMWPDCSIVHGKPRHPQSQGSVERGNADIFVTCSVCANFVHELCSKACTPESVTYNLCSNEKNIISERRNASESMKRQATRMRNISERILSDVDIGTNVLIPIPNVDRGKGDPRNVLVVVINKDELGYKLGTKSGTLRGLYTGNQFELSDRKYLHIGSINNEHELSFRQAARSV